ncbi:MAG: hypothetical protein JWR49_1882 [Tardiphaga sp.]|nr:hypothetical protein [Tardiphaga sp.]
MKIWVLIGVLLMASPAWAQSKPTSGRADPCAPIGRTADGKLVYGMKCENLPVPVAPMRAETAPQPAPAPAEEEDKGGLFRNPFPSIIKPSNTERVPGVGPPPSGR